MQGPRRLVNIRYLILLYTIHLESVKYYGEVRNKCNNSHNINKKSLKTYFNCKKKKHALYEFFICITNFMQYCIV